MNLIKICGTCKIEKTIGDFCKRSASKDGLSAKCKACQSEYDKKRAMNPDRVAARLAYAKTDAGIESAKRAKKKYSDNHKDEATIRCREYRAKFPKKSRAHDMVAYAVRIGSLHRMPCEICGADGADAHHDDYDMPIDVRWLCPKHHREWHRENGDGATAS